MIEIIKQGTKNRVECNNCGALLSYQTDDVRENYYGRTFLGYEKYIICPQCSNRIILEASK